MFKRFTAGVAVGYVLGARAGRKRYDQIAGLAQQILDLPLVEGLGQTGRDLVASQTDRLLTTIKDRAQWSRDDHDLDDRNGPVRDDEEESGVYQEEAGPPDAPEDQDGPEDPDGQRDREDDEVDEAQSDDRERPHPGRAERSEPHRQPASDRQSGSRHRIGSLAASARERGKVD